MTKCKKETSSGSVCGGVISHSQSIRDMKKYGVWANVMAYVLPDERYEEYVAFKKLGKEEEAIKIFNNFAISQI